MRTAKIVSIAVVSYSKQGLHSGEIEDNSTEKGFVTIILNNSTFPGTWVVPRSFTGAQATEVAPSTSRCLGVINKNRVEDRGVGVQIAFLKAVQDHARRRRDNL